MNEKNNEKNQDLDVSTVNEVAIHQNVLDALSAEIESKIQDAHFRAGTGLHHYDLAKMFVNKAFTYMDFNGGKDDTLHAAKQMMRLVVESMQAKNPTLTEEDIHRYAKKVNGKPLPFEDKHIRGRS